MKNEIEKEYKILLSEFQFNKLCSLYKNLKFVEQTNTYFDTPQYNIRDMHGAMRLRQKDGVIIFTLKMHTNSGLMEHEGIVPFNNISVFDLPDVKKVLDIYQIHGPFLKTTICVTKRAVVITEEAELCFDINIFQNGYIDYEVEYEYKKSHNGLKVFNRILSQIGLTYTTNCDSKIKRALDFNV